MFGCAAVYTVVVMTMRALFATLQVGMLNREATNVLMRK